MSAPEPSSSLRRVVGLPTAWLVGMGIAIGSGIFRTPGEVAAHLPASGLIVLAWVLGGLLTLVQGLVNAELSTRFPRAGGEYVYLREAYGDFAAFFFGWVYTVFILGGGAALIALAFGDFASTLLGDAELRWSQSIAAGAMVAVTAANAAGLRAGAVAQNVLTLLKVLALLAVVAAGWFGAGAAATTTQAAAAAQAATQAAPAPGASLAGAMGFIAALMSVHWSYDGATDSVKLAEEIRDVRRALPRALLGATLSLTLLYVLFNVALLRLVPPGEMAGQVFVPGEALRRVFGPAGRDAVLLVAMLACLGAISSTLLATVRVTFALARDGLAFGFLARMSRAQAPVAALVAGGTIGVAFCLWKDFREMMKVYYLAAAVLFAMAFASLIVFRLRDRGRPEGFFRCPAGPLLAGVLIVAQTALAANVVYEQRWEVLYTGGLLVAVAALYLVWRATMSIAPRGHPPPGD